MQCGPLDQSGYLADWKEEILSIIAGRQQLLLGCRVFDAIKAMKLSLMSPARSFVAPQTGHLFSTQAFNMADCNGLRSHNGSKPFQPQRKGSVRGGEDRSTKRLATMLSMLESSTRR